MNVTDWHVLVVEDDHYGWEVVSRMLEFRHIGADIATTAEDALEALATQPYTAVIIDLALPGMDGWSLLQQIKDNADTAHLPCIAMTAYHDSRVAQEARRAGFVGYFPKPLNTSFAEEVEKTLASL
ncbi:MAG: response regulator [Burkholderiales bacterium]|nr:response regulator [Anaerolineae bacterium]